jgi:drug/metabolite transporter (DMT)-like permease
MKLSRHQKAIVAVTICTIIWNAAAPLFKWSMESTPPFTLLFFRFLLATLIMLPIVWKRINIKFDDFWRIFLLAVTGITLNIGLVYLGLSLSPSINAPIIASTMPLFLIIGAIFFLKEIPRPKVILGMTISILGVLIIMFRPVDHMTLYSLITGNLYFILSVLSLTSFTILLKWLKPPYAPTTVIFFPFFVMEEKATRSMMHVSFQGGFGILYGAILCSVVGQLLYNFSVKELNSAEIGLFTYLGPIVTALVAIPLLHEIITFGYLLGALFVFLGLFIAELKLKYHPFHHHIPDDQDSWLESGP